MGKRRKADRTPIRDLKAHTESYVTVGELAEYWLVSRKQIYKQIEAGTLRAIKLGPRLLRIRTPDAIDFERQANMHPHQPHQPAQKSARQQHRSYLVADHSTTGRHR